MTKWELKRLKRQLQSNAPFIGPRLRRQAARALAKDGSRSAIQLLAQSLTFSKDEHVHQIAQKTISKIDNQSAINTVCKVWYQTRQQWIGEQIKNQKWVASTPSDLRVFSALQAGKTDTISNGSDKVIPGLILACKDQDTKIAKQAQSCLSTLRKSKTVDALCNEWVNTRDPLLEEAIIQSSYTAKKPIKNRVLTALKVGELDILSNERSHVVGPLLHACEDHDPIIAESAYQVLVSLKTPDSKEEVCRYVIDEDHPKAHKVAKETEYIPQDIHRRALFFFMVKEWDQYESLDFDQRILRAAYITAPPSLRQRILRNIRISGRADWLDAISGSEITIVSQGVANDLVQMLASNRQWEKLWEKVFELPYSASLAAMKTLSPSGWRPSSAEEHRLFNELTQLSNNGLKASPENIIPHIPSAIQRAHVRLVNQRINDLSFSPNRPVIAVCTSGRKIALWDFHFGEKANIISGFDHSLGEVAFCGENQLVFAERTNSSADCSTYLFRENEVTRVYQQKGSVTALEPVGKDRMLVGGRDFTITLLNLEEGRAISKTRQLNYWPRAFSPITNDRKLALLHYGIEIISLDDNLQKIAELSPYQWKHGVIHCAAFSTQNDAVIAGTFKGEVYILPLPFNHATYQVLNQHQQRIQGIEFLKKHNLVVSADASGEVQMMGWANRKMLGKIRTNGKQLTSLHISPDGSFMALGDSDASVSLWDLRCLDIPDMLKNPLIDSSPNHLAALRSVIENKSINQGIRNTLIYLERILRHRFRFDVEISSVTEIKSGEYDIEIE
jgi:WD40 repeat protein